MQTLLAALLKVALEWVYQKVAGLVSATLALRKKKEAIEKEAGGSVVPSEQAKTEKEVDDAARNTLSGV